MKAARYTNAYVQNTPVMFGGSAPSQYGTLLSEYDVAEYWDLRTAADGLGARRAYVVNLRQRLTIANKNAGAFAGGNPPSYVGYPILAIQTVQPATTAQNLIFYLEDYSPKTLNAAVTTSQNQGTNSSDASSVQHTTGSSTSVTNSYEVSASAGFFGLDPTGSVSAGYTNSTTDTQERSTSRGNMHEQGREAGSGSSMSVKNWASYAYLDDNKQQPSWVWGQEYPWNVIDFNSSTDGGHTITLPNYMQELLCDGTFLYPPSQISQFGLNFVAHAKWVFYVDGAAGAVDEQVSFKHLLSYWEASHTAVGTAPNLTVQPEMQPVANAVPVETLTINLPLLALKPVAGAGSGNGAVVGFVASEFIIAPDAAGTAFRLKSNAGNLYVSQGTGFGPLADDDSVLTAANVTASAPAKYTLQFKIADPDLELSLHLRHWKTSPAGCAVTIEVNGQTIVRHVDAMNVSSGADNISSVTLRSRDYTSNDFYDYLVMGLNTVTVTVTPADGAASCGYALRALAVQ